MNLAPVAAMLPPDEATAAQLAAIVEGSQDAIIGQDPHGVITSWNRAAARMYGYDADEVIGRPIAIVVPPDRREELPSIYARLARGEAVPTVETKRVTKSGRVIDVSLSVSAMRDRAGRLVGFSSIARDITERNRVEAEHRRQHQLLMDFVENATEGLHWVGPDGTILWANKAELDLLGYERDDYVGRNIAEFHVDRDAIRDVLRRLGAGEKLESYEARLRRKDGTIRHVLINSNVYWEDGRFVHTRCFTRDITGRKRVEEELRDAQQRLQLHAEELERTVAQRTAHLQETIQSLEGVCYTMAHDLRAPLRSIHSFTEILLDDYSPHFDEEGRRLAQRILAATARMDVMIRDLLDFARLSHVNAPSTPVNLDEEMTMWLRQLEGEINARQAVVTVRRPLPVVLGNRLVLDQAFTNLIANALKFMPPGRTPEVEITSEVRDGTAFVTVRDNGIGIAPENHERIFGLFQRLHTAQEFPGTGVGLAIVRKAIDRMGGRVTLTSAPGKGSAFTVHLPAAPAA